jgi:rhodanese-related sulfurtransferase
VSADEIFARAAERGRALGVSYAGAVTPAEAHRLQSSGAAPIVDVRTREEWKHVGRVPDSVLIEWRRRREGSPNPGFLAELAARFEREKPILFLCRSAVRSHHAAEAARGAGFTRTYNILEGFEGPLDEGSRHGGWRAAGLPWEQG